MLAAGYCVVTYLLGVGDRHLDNLLVAPDGKYSLIEDRTSLIVLSGHFFHGMYDGISRITWLTRSSSRFWVHPRT